MLSDGARIAVVAPSGAWDEGKLRAGMELLQAWGYRPELLPGATARWRYCAGDDATRLGDLQAAFVGPWDAVWMARGGYGLLRLLPALPALGVPAVPFLGFSDGTALLNPLADLGGTAVHAPVLTSLGSISDAASREHLRRLLRGEPTEPLTGVTLVPGEARGPLRGGNLCTLAASCGTPWALRGRGAIVVLEDVGESAYKVDRMLTQLLHSGCLDGAVGVACGQFDGAAPASDAGYTLLDVLCERLGPLGVPVVADLPVGHGAANRAFRLAPARLADGALCL